MRTRTLPAGNGPAEGGFTLIELLVVLAIIGLLMVSIPGFLWRDNAAFNLDRSTQKMAESLQAARSAAITTNREQILSIDVERRQFLIPKAKAPVQLPAGVNVGFITARQEQSSESIGRIRFFPDGSSTGGRIILAVGDIRNIIEIDWLTGVISVIDAVP